MRKWSGLDSKFSPFHGDAPDREQRRGARPPDRLAEGGFLIRPSSAISARFSGQSSPCSDAGISSVKLLKTQIDLHSIGPRAAISPSFSLLNREKESLK
jgi:hypothetical protein